MSDQTCKHCGLSIERRPNTDGWVHAEGGQKGLHRCALKDYGYDAEAVDEPCSFACRGFEAAA
jgi:hypothetical protein